MSSAAADSRPLYLPVILGTPRQGRFSEHVARFVLGQVRKLPGVETELVDVRTLAFPTSDAGEDIKNADFSKLCMRADGFVIVAPEYNHAYPGILKHALDTNLKEYVHKAAGVVGVSAGPWGGTRVVQSLLPVLRELGLVAIFWDGNFTNVQKLFGATGDILDAAYERRLEKFLKELVWMAKVLRHGRENVPLD
ncbi:MAG: NADPH-dependent FMN reductase [Acidobacteriota bacterium]